METVILIMLSVVFFCQLVTITLVRDISKRDLRTVIFMLSRIEKKLDKAAMWIASNVNKETGRFK
jgi:hypothetical protein